MAGTGRAQVQKNLPPGDRSPQFERKLDQLLDIAADDAIKEVGTNRFLRKEKREIDVKF